MNLSTTVSHLQTVITEELFYDTSRILCFFLSFLFSKSTIHREIPLSEVSILKYHINPNLKYQYLLIPELKLNLLIIFPELSQIIHI